MNSETLKAMQAPVKERYRSQPDSARATLHAEGRVGPDVSFRVETAAGTVAAGLHPGTGGDGSLACSGDMLLEALVGCAGVTLSAVATAMGIVLRDGTRVRAEGDLDWRGTLGVSKEVPVGFQAIRLSIELDSDATDEQRATLLRLTERYCVVMQTLKQPAQISASLVRAGG
jgi:uncharacterized OsmC-like protein